MKYLKRILPIIISVVFIFNLCGCDNYRIKTVKKTTIIPVTEYRTRVIGQRIIGEDNSPYLDENENGIIDDFEEDNSSSNTASSDKSGDNTSEENNSSTTPEKPMTDNFIEDGKFNYRIIRSSSSQDFVTVVTRNFASEIKEKLNCTVEFKTDAISASKNIRELIIGSSNRPASAYAEKLLRKNRANCYYDAIVCTVGNDICIFGYEKEALVKATEHFITVFCDGNTKKVPTDYSWIYEGNSSHTVYPNPISISIGNSDVSKYRIIIPKEYSSYDIGCATYLQTTIADVSGIPVDIAIDTVTPVENEIHIGKTNRNITPNADEKKYVVKFIDGKLYYSVKDEELQYMAIKDLCEKLKSAKTSFSIPATYDYTGTYYDLKCSFGDGYNLVWYEDFNEITDLSVKTNNYGLKDKYWTEVLRKEYGDKYKTTFDTKTNAKLDGLGNLKLISEHIDERNFRSAEITTEGKTFFKYGYFELRLKFAGGSGTSNVWWFNSSLSSKDRPEIDVYEQFGNEKSIVSNLHSWNVGTNNTHYDHGAKEEAGDWPFNRKFIPEGTELIANGKYRIIGMEWTDKTITFYADGLPYCTWDIRDPIYDAFRAYPVYTLLECYGSNKNQGYESADALVQYIDYLRVYQKDSSAGFESYVSSSGAKNYDKKTDISMPLPLS